ncbi:glucose transporter, putative [Eimeria maxima]|uniref:Glucose transporter, putative n=1 Tax=Eimeria maxima TaxID=5804 RepID=U6MA82_EIMMA|nr:glucose transporter, putative [Eimeria maxima]CDJ61107.1 glucose transporter, putative [Eimeria maxima]
MVVNEGAASAASVAPAAAAAIRQQQQQEQQQQEDGPCVSSFASRSNSRNNSRNNSRSNSHSSSISSSSTNNNISTICTSSSCSRGSSRLWLCSCAVGLFVVAAGFAVCAAAAALQPLQHEFKLCGSKFACSEKGAFVAVLAPGAAVGSLVGGYIADRIGRWWSLFSSSILFLLSTAIIVLAPTYPLVLLGRAFQGVFVAVGLVVSFTFAAEIAPAKLRGSFVALQEVLQCTGCFLPYLVAWAIPGLSWRGLVGIAALFTILMICCLPLLPESPRYLLLQREAAAAERAMIRLGYSEQQRQQLLQSVQHQQQLQQQEQQEQELQQQQQQQQQQLGLCDLETVCSEESAPVPAAAATAVATKPGAKQANHHHSSLLGRYPVYYLLILLAVVFYYCGEPEEFLLLIWAYPHWVSCGGNCFLRLSPPRHRALGVGLASTCGWGVSIFFQLYGEPLLVYLGPDIGFLLFAILSLVVFFFTSFFVPELKGKELQGSTVG